MMNVLEVKDIYKNIGKRNIINGINFTIKEGEIFGFLGPNGAGKTTTVRMLVGLIAPIKGTIKIMGKDIQKERIAALKNVGCIVENPDMYNELTGIQNLKYYADLYGGISKERLDEVVKLIGLEDRINDKVKKYSLGMKQRLGLGQAILNKPKLLILDEPTNGLDPIGIHELRKIIKKLAKENGTAVFISSHILSEIEQVCDNYAVINNGVIKSIGSVKNSTCDIERINIYSDNSKKLHDIFLNLDFINSVTENDEYVCVDIAEGDFYKVVKELGKHEVKINNLYKSKDSLEDKFMKILEKEG